MTQITVASQDDVTEIGKNLIIYNAQQVPFMQKEVFVPLNFFIKEDNEIIGDMVAIDAIWVDERYRRHGYATSLLNRVNNWLKNGVVVFHNLTLLIFRPETYMKS